MNSRFSNRKLSNYIKAEAIRLGFYVAGIAKASPVEREDAEYIGKWIETGGYAAMNYMTNHTEMRLNPQLLMPGVESIVSVAMNYAPATTISKEQYQFAAYALGRDYHDLMKERLYELASSIKKYIEQNYEPTSEKISQQETSPSTIIDDVEIRVFCDTAPVLERYWAVKAGIGWIGRNHQLIIPGAGSMFFLGELFINLPLDYDQPMKSRCGICNACFDACPTGALQKDCKTFNAELCLSYQTIENRGEISQQAAKQIGNTIYGCDRCQLACPWNKFSKPTTEPHLQPSELLLKMTKQDWADLSIEDYRKIFKGSAVKRAKYEGLMRNIKVARENDNENENENENEN